MFDGTLSRLPAWSRSLAKVPLSALAPALVLAPIVVLALATFMAPHVAAQDIAPVSHSSLARRLDALEAEVARARTESYSTRLPASCCDGSSHVDGSSHGYPSGSCDGCSVPSCGGCCGAYCNTNPGVYAGVDAVVVKPFFEDGNEVDDSDNIGFGLDLSPRVWLGVRTEEGLGVRARYWWAEMDSDVLDGNQTQLKFKVFDLEGTRRVCWGPVDADFFGGIRYARVSHYYVRGGSDAERAGVDVEGLGPTIGVDTLTHLGNSNWGIVGNVRGAWLFGDVNSATNVALDKAFFPAEFRVGLQYSRCLGRGEFTLHALAEVQYWVATIEDSDGVGSTVQDDDLSLIGFTLGGQYRF